MARIQIHIRNDYSECGSEQDKIIFRCDQKIKFHSGLRFKYLKEYQKIIQSSSPERKTLLKNHIFIECDGRKV